METMIRNVARICLAIVACLLVSVFAELVIKPKDTESVVGGSAYFNCSTTILDPSRGIHWFHYTIGSSEKNMVYGFGEIRDRNYHGRFSVRRNNQTGEFNLVIIAILAQDAGTYECHDEAEYGNKSQAQLIVLDSKPQCQSDMPDAKVLGKNPCGIEPDISKLSCTATFRGNIAPVLEWRKVGESTPITQGDTPETSSNRITYNLTLNGDRVIDGSSYICQTTRSTEQYSCVSDVIRVLSPQNNFSIAERKSGESVRCPTIVENSCSYKWIRTDQNRETVVSTDQLVKLDVPGLFRCEADCRIRTKPCIVSAMLVHVAEDASTQAPFAGDPTGPSFKTAFIIVLIVLVICLITFLICFLRWQRLWKGRSKVPVLEMQPLSSAAIIPDLPANVAYSPNPTRIHAIKTESVEANDRSIKGTAILNNELFIISQLESEVEVYDCTTLGFRRKWQLNDLMDPDDATSCIRNRCIYISDNKADGKEIFRVDVDGQILNRWSIREESGRLSVTNESSVILSLHDSSRLMEYSPDGLLLREINLTATGLTHPMHAVRIVNGNFVMTQGYLEDRVHRVCEVNRDGKLVRFFGAEKGSGSGQLTNPTYLAVDREGSIMVADAGNGRVVLLSSNFEFKRELITRNNGLHIPTRICLDEVNGRLYVAEYKRDMKSLLVFNIR